MTTNLCETLLKSLSVWGLLIILRLHYRFLTIHLQFVTEAVLGHAERDDEVCAAVERCYYPHYVPLGESQSGYTNNCILVFISATLSGNSFPAI